MTMNMCESTRRYVLGRFDACRIKKFSRSTLAFAAFISASLITPSTGAALLAERIRLGLERGDFTVDVTDFLLLGVVPRPLLPLEVGRAFPAPLRASLSAQYAFTAR